MNAKIVIPGERRIEDVARGKGIQALGIDTWIPFPSHCFRNARPGMTLSMSKYLLPRRDALH
jgi:hypothetical protein